MHLLIPFAFRHSTECLAALATLTLPNLCQLISRLAPSSLEIGEETSLTPPHERAFASALGLIGPTEAIQDGKLPWAAWYANQFMGSDSPVPPHIASQAMASDSAWAFITPCQWEVQTSHITMADPDSLQLSESDSRELLAAMAPFFVEDGITLMYDRPNRWLAQSDIFRNLATASLDRVIGRPTDDWIPRAPEARLLRRLQQEMQMLLYTHPLTDRRAAQGLPTVNSFWVSAAGASAQPSGWPVPVVDGPIVIPLTLRDPALNNRWALWAQAWQHIDATECAELLASCRRGEKVSITLCGERHAQTWGNGLKHPLKRLFGTFMNVLAPESPSLLVSSL